MARFNYIAVALSALLLLSGCKSAALVCGPPLKQYTVAEMQQASREYKAAVKANDQVMLRKLADDYGVTRDAIRKCKERLKSK